MFKLKWIHHRQLGLRYSTARLITLYEHWREKLGHTCLPQLRMFFENIQDMQIFT